MAPPFSVPPGTLVVKVEDDTNDDQELRDMFTKDVRRWLELNRRRSLQSSGSTQLQPAPAPPVQQAPLSQPPPPPPPPPPAQHPCAKRPAIGPPPGFAGARAPPRKQYQRRPSGPNAPVQPPQQPAPPNAHRAPAPPAPNAQRAAGHAPQPAAVAGAQGAAMAATVAPPVPVHAAGPIVVPALQRRAAPKPKPAHPAAKKKPTVPCTFCGVLCMTAWHLKQHEQGRKHRNRVAYLAGEMNVRCSVCNVHLSSGLNVQQHNAGKQHLLRLHSHRGA